MGENGFKANSLFAAAETREFPRTQEDTGVHLKSN